MKNKIVKSKIFQYNFLSENRKGWVRIVEALVAILLIVGFLVVIFGNSFESGSEIDSSDIHKSENYVLREIQSNETFRNYILDQNFGSGDVEFDDFDTALKNHIENRVPEYLNCTSKICSLDSTCGISNEENNVYVKSAIISANSETYSPRQIKLFCWSN